MGAEPRVVDEHVDPAEPAHGRLDEVGAGVGIGDVGDDRERLASGRLHPSGRLAQTVLASAREHDVRACLGKRDGEGDAEAGGRSGDHGDVTVEAEPVEDVHGHTPAGRVCLTVGPTRHAVNTYVDLFNMTVDERPVAVLRCTLTADLAHEV